MDFFDYLRNYSIFRALSVRTQTNLYSLCDFFFLLNLKINMINLNQAWVNKKLFANENLCSGTLIKLLPFA